MNRMKSKDENEGIKWAREATKENKEEEQPSEESEGKR
jgi:hypothetical protein